jgi:predicted kinase
LRLKNLYFKKNMKNKQKVIVITGLGWTWKTYLAKVLSKKLNIVCFFKDEIKIAIFDELDLETNFSYKILYNLSEKQIKNWVDIMIESALWYETDIELFNNWLTKYDIDLYCIVCNIDNEIRKKRILWRKRHICHKNADKIALENLYSKQYDYSKLPWKLINITTNKPVEELANEIIKKINS